MIRFPKKIQGLRSPNITLSSQAMPSESQILVSMSLTAEELDVNVLEKGQAVYFHRMSCHLLLGLK
jgi:hypothetical protein